MLGFLSSFGTSIAVGEKFTKGFLILIDKNPKGRSSEEVARLSESLHFLEGQHPTKLDRAREVSTSPANLSQLLPSSSSLTVSHICHNSVPTHNISHKRFGKTAIRSRSNPVWEIQSTFSLLNSDQV
ncbi:hypothetical protein CKAN_01262600 [Cinnamomum micranthum f. kanehirae]|uniref:Uncharacterized protein n=1 Tax=Cinnamomum micranthum f. kanehirae TaxID=337451 RepID=A0A443NZE4_9MAGN|nr:hypothetical protein CKAN_01262600 [Cinnamomum micranthum f. kanehirae]